MNTPAIQSYSQLTARVALLQKSASSPMGSGDPLKEPDSTHATGTAEAKKTDGDNKGKMQLPPDGTMGSMGKDPSTTETKPSGVGQNVPTTTTVPAIDPNPDFNTTKLAGEALELAKRASGLMSPVATAQPKVAAATVENPDANIQFDPQFHFKIASIVLGDQGLINQVQSVIERDLGANEAMATIKNAAVAHQQFIEADAQLQAQSQEEEMLKQAFTQASPAEQQEIIKVATAHEAARRHIHPDCENAYRCGVDDAEIFLNYTKHAGAMPPGMEGGAGGAPGGEMPPDAGAAAGGPEGAEGGTPSPEEIIHVLKMLVDSGEIDQATAEQVAQHIMSQQGGGAGGAPGGEGGAPGAAPESPVDGGAPGGAAPSEEAPGEEAPGEDIAKKAASMLVRK